MPQVAMASAVLLADGGDLQARERAGVEPVLLELLADGLHGVDARERHPLVAALDEAADGLVDLLRVARRLDRDGRHLLGDGAEGPQAGGQAGRLLLGARHEHAPAVQRLGLEPRQRLAHRDDLADDGDGRRRHAGVGRRPWRCRPASRRAWSARWWCPPGSSRPASRESGRPRRARRRPRRCGRRPRAAPGCRRRRARTSRSWRRRRAPPRTRGCERLVSGTPAYAGTAETDEMPGTISKPMPAFAQASGLLGPGRVRERVAGDEPHDVRAGLGVPHHEAGAGGVRQRLAVLADAAVDDLDVRADEGCDEVGVLGQLGDDDVGLREELGGPHGEQAGVAGTGAHEADVAQRAASLARSAVGVADAWVAVFTVLVSFLFCRVVMRRRPSGRRHLRRASRQRDAHRPRRHRWASRSRTVGWRARR